MANGAGCVVFFFSCFLLYLLGSVVFFFFSKILAFILPKRRNYTVQFNGVKIETSLTNSALLTDSLLDEFRSKRLIGLDVEWNSASHTNKVATLQLCHGTRCIIIQLLHLNSIPNSLRNLLLDRSITFVGVGIKQDIARLDRDYGLKCWSGDELGPLADMLYGTNRFAGAGLASLMHQIVGVRIEKSHYVTRSDWSANNLSIEQIKYATIDAYASFAIGSTLLCGYN